MAYKEGKVSNGGATKDPNDVVKTLSDNATVDASQKGGVAAVAANTSSQQAMQNLTAYYAQQQAQDNANAAYADSLTGGKYTQDMNYANYLTGGKMSGYLSYADYLAASGQTVTDSQKVRDQSVAQATADYNRQLASYGQTGEQLARSGLANTGYSDAMNASAYAAKQNAIVQADATKAAVDQSNRLGYAQYLQAYDAQQQEKMYTALEYTTAAGMTKDQAIAYAKALGFDDTIAESIGKANEAYTNAAKANSNSSADLYNQLISTEGFTYSPDTVNSLKTQLKNSGYDDATIEETIKKFESTYKAQQDDTYGMLMKALTDDETFDRIGASIDGWDEMSDSEKANAYNRLVAKADITEDQRVNILTKNIEEISKKQGGGNALNELASYKNIAINEETYNRIAEKIANSIQLSDKKYSVYGQNIDVDLKFAGGDAKLQLQCTDRDDQNISMTILGNHQNGEVFLYNGEFYRANGNGKYTRFNKVIGETDEQTDVWKDLLASKGNMESSGSSLRGSDMFKPKK